MIVCLFGFEGTIALLMMANIIRWQLTSRAKGDAVTERQLDIARRMWGAGCDSLTISRALALPEAVVYNWLAYIYRPGINSLVAPAI